jgi:hypothetical protein
MITLIVTVGNRRRMNSFTDGDEVVGYRKLRTLGKICHIFVLFVFKQYYHNMQHQQCL